MKKIVLLGSTGSIGVQTLELLDNYKEFQVDLLAAGKNVDLLEKQILKYKPEYTYMENRECSKELKNRLSKTSSCKVLPTLQDLIQLLKTQEFDMIINAIVGMKGILPTLAAVEAGHRIAIANKETLVCAGHILMPLSKKTGAEMIPIDSEHSAIAQCIAGETVDSIDHLIITASGGPFFGKDVDLSKVRVEDALKHPNWSMGAKITIDSATMVNKALEVMEAKWLFDMELSDIKVLIHPGSIVHSMVCFKDGAIKAQLGVPNMKLPIGYALFQYNRIEMTERLNLAKIGNLEFYPVEEGMFAGFDLGLKSASIGGSMPTVFNAANEIAVSEFLNGRISFCDISKKIEAAMEGHTVLPSPSIEEILEIEAELRKQETKFFNI